MLRARGILLVGLVLALALLAGCGEKDEPEVQAPIAAQPTESEPTDPEPAPPEPRPPNQPNEPDRPAPRPPKPPGELIATAVRAVLASGNPDLACRRYATGRLLATSFGGLAGCIAATNPRTAARSVRLTGLLLNGRVARVVAIPRGGTSSGQRVRVALLLREGRWRVDSLRSNVPVGP